MAKVSSGTRIAAGRAGDVSFAAPGLMEFLRAASQAIPDFDKAMRKAAEEVAQKVVDDAKKNAAAQPPHGKNNTSGRSQAQVVATALRARRDRIPTIKLDHKRGFVSKSRSNRRRTRTVQGPFLRGMRKPGTVTMGDVFYGAEFGGRARKTTKQFLRHRGRQGYFFWQAVRDNKSYIVKEYSDAIERVLKELAKGAT
ncbi:MAG: hypothetical protein EBR82_79610 [Caulobacteraceae bacterium]|nr:hypothetical protein [Caulobacteraceae bacterium]